MLGVDTFLTALYVMLDGFRQSRLQKERYPGPDASLSCSEFVSPSSPGGLASRAKGISTVTRAVAWAMPSPHKIIRPSVYYIRLGASYLRTA